MNLVVYFRWPYCGTVTQSIYYAYFTSYLSSKLTYSFFFAAGFNSFASRSAKLSPLLSNYQNPTVIFDWYGVATEAVIGAVSRAGRQSHRLQDGERGIPLILHTLYGNTTEYFSDLPSTLPIIKKNNTNGDGKILFQSKRRRAGWLAHSPLSSPVTKPPGRGLISCGPYYESLSISCNGEWSR